MIEPQKAHASEMPSSNSPSIGRTHKVLAGWIGFVIHGTARIIRRVVAATAECDQANIAVLCVGFLRYGCAQAVGFQEEGLNVTLYYVDRRVEFAESQEDRELVRERAQAAGVEIVRVPRRRIQSLLTHIIWLHQDLRRRKIATAVVHSHIDPRYATLGLALPVALIVHDPQAHSGDTFSAFPLPVRLMARFSELTSFCLIIHSVRLVEQVLPLLRCLPIGVTPLGAEMTRAPAPIPRERRLLIFGRLFAYKGVDTALEAFRSLPEDMSDTKLIVAGRGPLADLARGQRNVEVRDEYIPESDVHNLLSETRLVLLPYKDATQSGVGVDAVAHGVPCLVSSVGGLPELVPDSLPSLVVPPDNPERLAEAIVAHMDHDEAFRRTIYDHAATHLAWPVAVRRLRSELQRLGLDVGS